MGRRALFRYRARYDVIEFPNCLANCRAEERREAEFFSVQFENEMASYCAL